MQSHGSVGALVYHKQHDAVVVVRQFRPAVWAWSKLEAEQAGQAEPPITAAFTYELCAGPIIPAFDFKLLSLSCCLSPSCNAGSPGRLMLCWPPVQV